jgi:hypothetical protein
MRPAALLTGPIQYLALPFRTLGPQSGLDLTAYGGSRRATVGPLGALRRITR